MRKPKTLMVNSDQMTYLNTVIKDKYASARIRRRAYILLYKAEGFSNDDIALMLGVSRITVMRWLERYKTEDWDDFIDCFNKSTVRKNSLNRREREWILHIAGTRPQKLGCPHSRWTCRKLAMYISENAKDAGFAELEGIRYSQVYRLFHESGAPKSKA